MIFDKLISISKSNNKVTLLLTLTILLVTLLGLPFFIAAQQPAQPQIDIKAILGRVRVLLWTILSGLAVIMIVWAGILYLLARGEPSKVGEANKALVWAVVGIIVGVLAYSVNKIVRWFIGI